MLKTYLKTAWRSLKNNKIFSFINIFGLSAGLACCMLIMLYLHNELNYDGYHRNGKDLYELCTVFNFQHKESIWGNTPAPMGQGMQREFPEIEESTRLMALSLFEDKTLLQYNNPAAQQSSFYETNGFLVDSNFFRMFTYHFTEGDPATALMNPATVVLSEEIAHKIFGNQSALNKVIHISSNTNGEHNYTVTGVFRPLNAPSHIDGRFFMSMNGGDMEGFIKQQSNDYATNNMFFTYLRLKPGSDPGKLEAKFPSFLHKYASESLKAIGFDKRQFLVQLKDIHLRSDITNNVTPAASKTYLYILASIALFTLIIACINFMNLATARSSKRSAEVGVRKVLGAEKKWLIVQFLGESVIMSLIAFVFACLITLLLLPAFNMMTDKSLSLSFPEHIPLMIGFLGLAIGTGLLAGSYPALYLSSFKPVQVLKGKFKNSLAAVSLRKGLVVFQFMISVALIFSAVVINDQMNFLRAKDLGFEKSGQIIIPLRSEKAKKIYGGMKNMLAGNRSVITTGGSAYYPGIRNPGDQLYYIPGQTSQQAQRVRQNYVDGGYFRALGIQTVAGRVFAEDNLADTNNRVILNENAIQALGYASPAEAIGKKIMFNYQGKPYSNEIIGVVKDFHFEDLHLPITPYAFLMNNPPLFNYMVVHARPGQMAQLLKDIEADWHSLNPGEPFEYSFLDEDFQKNYKAEERLSAMIRYFTIMAILISCLGLFGLASFSAEQRIKEIGIRKVLGASIGGIVVMLSKDFLKLIGVAILIASPLAWYAMRKWLEDFAYRVDLSWTIFLLTVVLTLFVALFTISFQAIRAALANPVQSLKAE
jgi:putative ABC transport system permease protein